MTYAAESYAQKTMISLEVRNETVGTVLEKLKKESGFDFFFNNKHVDLKRIVSVSANNVSIRPRACFFPLFSFLPLWLHYNLNPLCVQY